MSKCLDRATGRSPKGCTPIKQFLEPSTRPFEHATSSTKTNEASSLDRHQGESFAVSDKNRKKRKRRKNKTHRRTPLPSPTVELDNSNDDSVICLTPKKQSSILDHFAKKQGPGSPGITRAGGTNESIPNKSNNVANDVPVPQELQSCLSNKGAIDNLSVAVTSTYRTVTTKPRKLQFNEQDEDVLDVDAVLKKSSFTDNDVYKLTSTSEFVAHVSCLLRSSESMNPSEITESIQPSSSACGGSPSENLPDSDKETIDSASTVEFKPSRVTSVSELKQASHEEDSESVILLSDSDKGSIHSSSTVEFQHSPPLASHLSGTETDATRPNDEGNESFSSASTDELYIPTKHRSALSKHNMTNDTGKEEERDDSRNMDVGRLEDIPESSHIGSDGDTSKVDANDSCRPTLSAVLTPDSDKDSTLTNSKPLECIDIISIAQADESTCIKTEPSDACQSNIDDCDSGSDDDDIHLVPLSVMLSPCILSPDLQERARVHKKTSKFRVDFDRLVKETEEVSKTTATYNALMGKGKMDVQVEDKPGETAESIDEFDKGDFPFPLSCDSATFVVSESRLKSLPPGLNVIDKRQAFCLFACFKDVTLKDCGFGCDPSTTPKELQLLSIPDRVFLEIMKFADAVGDIKFSPGNLRAVMVYMLRVVSVDHRLELSHKFMMSWLTIYRAIRSRGEAGRILCPSFDDILLIFCNAGVVAGSHCPVSDKISAVQERYSRLATDKRLNEKENNGKQTSLPQSARNTLPGVIEILTSIICDCSSYTDQELADLILIVAWLSLDKDFLGKNSMLVFECFLRACLDKISKSEWPKMLGYLATSLHNIGNHHHNVWYVTCHLPLSSRGVDLQKAVSFLALQSLRGVKDVTLPHEITPDVVLRFLCDHPISKGEDLYLLYHFLWFADLAIGPPNHTTPRSTLEGLCKVFSNMREQIRETVHCTEASVVKNRIISMIGTYKQLAAELPSQEPCLFAKMSGSESAEYIFM